MKQEILKALRTGEIRGVKITQARHFFFPEENRCCAGGVACLVAHPELKWMDGGVRDTTKPEYKAYGFDYLPWGDTIQDKVAKMNNGGKTFAEIADWLEVNWNP